MSIITQNKKNVKNILFRADSSSKIGLGHIMRDLVLASKYKNATITFATQDLDGNINYKILKDGYKVKNLKSNSKKELVKLIKKLKIDLLVIDHYKIDFKKEKYIKEKTGVKIFSLDDTYEKHYCDILLNHNIGADKLKYKKLVPSTCKVKCGSKYTLIRKEFVKERKRKRVFIAMGGSDYKNINLKILKALNNIKHLQIILVITSSNLNITFIKNYIKKKNIKLYIDSSKIAKLIKKSDFAIVSPSVMVHEVLYMNIPFISIKTANNQNEIYKYLEQNKYNVLKKFNKKKLLTKIIFLQKVKNVI